jgi:elongator complex protein 3
MRAPRAAFDPTPYEDALAALVRAVAAAPALDARGLDRILREHPKGGKGFFSKSEILAGARHLAARRALEVDAAHLAERLLTKPVRTLSGVAPVTVLTRPYPCPGRCVFCPSDVRMPKSYLADEPGAQRAEANAFDPYRQTWSRLEAFRQLGHDVDKVELIVLGGTWSFHPEPYQRWFVLRCLDALHDFGRGIDGRAEAARRAPADAPARDRIDGRAPGRSYNHVIARHLRASRGGALTSPHEDAGWSALRAAQQRNESDPVRCVGLVLETRPDAIDAAEVLRLRRLGATKLQLGVQSTRDDRLAENGRGHDAAATRRAIRLLRGAGFKLHAHWMANLVGGTPESDRADFAALFGDPGFRPDELKLYPTSLVETAELMAYHARGEWQPYADGELLELVCDCIRRVPRWCRLTRVVRDIPGTDIVAGSRVTNLREVAEARLAAAGVRLQEIRSREIRARAVDPAELSLRRTQYETTGSREVFLEWTARDDWLAAFLRLSLPREKSAVGELGRAAIVRELHVYGRAARLGARSPGLAQHAGLGESLLARAAEIAREAGHASLAVISAMGTRPYYRRLGFADGDLYPQRGLS